MIPLYSSSEFWELGLEADGPDALLTIFRSGPCPEVSTFEKRTALTALREGILGAIDKIGNDTCPTTVANSLRAAEHALRHGLNDAGPLHRKCRETAIAPRVVKGLAFRAQANLRVVDERECTGQTERSDLHALLFLGDFGVCARGRTWSIPDAPIFLVAERLVELAEAAVTAHQSATALFRRLQVGNVRVGVRLVPADGPLAVSLNAAHSGHGQGVTFPELEPSVFAQSVSLFVVALRDAIVELDRSQVRNLRIQNLVSAAVRVAEMSRPQKDHNSLVNSRPEVYKRFATPIQSSKRRWEQGTGLRFSLRFAAAVPQIDLKSTFFCGDSLIIGSQRETSCLDPVTGASRWRVPSARAASIGTPAGLIRVFPDGRLVLHDLESGNQRFNLRLTPRAQGGACGAVVFAPGLPRLLAICEGDRRVSAIDLMSGEVRWRYTATRPAPLRVRRAGGLLLIAGGDSTMVALDAATGDVVWRACDRMPFTGDMSVVGDEVFALSSGAHGNASLHAYDVWSGELRWKTQLDDRPIPGQCPLVAPAQVLIAVRDARGCGVRAVCRASGDEVWNLENGFFPRSVAWLVVDDSLVVNSAAAGTFTCIDAATSTLKYRHVFSQGGDSDQPRKLEPVLRCGALFVPQHQVQVVRPTDGTILGVVPCDLVPDLIRVDDRHGVVVAEESGHLSSFSVAPLLFRVK